MPPALVSANKEVKLLLEESKSGIDKGKNTRGTYYNYSDEERLKVGKKAAEMGVTSTIRHYKEELKNRPLKESTIRTWMNPYKKCLAVSKVIGKDEISH